MSIAESWQYFVTSPDECAGLICKVSLARMDPALDVIITKPDLGRVCVLVSGTFGFVRLTKLHDQLTCIAAARGGCI